MQMNQLINKYILLLLFLFFSSFSFLLFFSSGYNNASGGISSATPTEDLVSDGTSGGNSIEVVEE
jgi:hypothetical protein